MYIAPVSGDSDGRDWVELGDVGDDGLSYCVTGDGDERPLGAFDRVSVTVTVPMTAAQYRQWARILGGRGSARCVVMHDGAGFHRMGYARRRPPGRAY